MNLHRQEIENEISDLVSEYNELEDSCSGSISDNGLNILDDNLECIQKKIDELTEKIEDMEA